MAKRVLVVLAEGFEEIEAVIPIDVLRRLEFDVTVAGLIDSVVTGAHGLAFNADCMFDNVDAADFDAVLLPGGMPGSANLRDNISLGEFIIEMYDAGKLVTAICAAPIALGKAGILKGKKATCYPGFEDQLDCGEYTANRTEVAGNVITGKGPGAAFEFVVKVATALGKGVEVEKLYSGMFVNI
jgi:4-methyl-5(b-hydroxyethyl)-thiazole monophosphate biosynthesis